MKTMIRTSRQLHCLVSGNSLEHHCRRRFATWPRVYPKRLRVITCDVTGTIVSFRGSLEQHYLGAAQKCGIRLESDLLFAPAFYQAYKETSRWHPCFGGSAIPAKEWWKKCVLRSFDLAKVNLNEHEQDAVFQRIYSTFGSQQCYEKFSDALPFLQWTKRRNLVCGVLSNADERYGDSILPMLGLSHDELQFQCYSKDFGIEKPDPRFYKAALDKARPWITNEIDDPILPSQVLHIGNDFKKDFEGARQAGMHAVLLERYDNHELAQEWKRRGALVFEDLLDVVEFLGRCKCQLG